MAKINTERMTAKIDGDFVVFLIGFRVNRWWKFWRWIPIFFTMPRMLIELGKHPELGLLHARTHFGFGKAMVVQYWRSFEALHAYSTSGDRAHRPAWKAFNKAIGTRGDVGIWHETYLIQDGQHESVFGNMPPYGLGMAGELVPAKGQQRSARGRLKRADGQDQPIMDDGGDATKTQDTQA